MKPAREQSEAIDQPETDLEKDDSRGDSEGAASSRPAATGASDEVDEVAAWVGKAQAGDMQAFESLIVHFQDRVWRRALYRLRDQEEAFDLAQEVFLICFRKIEQFRGESKFWTWLCRIVDNQVHNRQGWLKRRGKGRTYSIDQPPGQNEDETKAWDLPDPGADPRRQAAGHEALEALNRHLDELSEDHREILLLRFADGLSYDEIAETLSLTLGTVKSRINRARKELREAMGAFLEP